MKRKPIKIAWDDLEDAFNDQNEDLVHYLDLVTGHVVLEGEGELDEFDDDEETFESRAPASEATVRNDATRLDVHPPDLEHKLDWLRSFVSQERGLGPELVEQLEQVPDADDPSEALADVLRQHPEVKDRWFLFRTERLHEEIEEWLEGNGVEAVDPPPWKS